MTKHTKEQKKSLILNHLDEQAEKKEFNINNFTINNISKKLGIEKEEAKELVEELINDGDLERENIEYDVVFPKGDYKELKKELKKMEFFPIGMDNFTWLIIGGCSICLMMVISGIYNDFLQDFINNPLVFIVGIIILITLSYFFGYFINEIYKKILKKNDTIRQQVAILRPVFLIGLVIWVIMFIPFAILYYFLDEQLKMYSFIYLVITFPTTILTAIEYQRYAAKKQ